MSYLLLAVVAAGASCVLTSVVRRYALRADILDVPNHRSAHRHPTPRGGGLAIVVVVLAGVVFLAPSGFMPRANAIALFGGGALVALIGWVDDRRGVSASTRLVIHTLAAAWAVYWLGGLAAVQLGGVTLTLGWVGSLLAVAGIVWFINLYNFMDGIDGLAASQALAAGAIAAALLLLRGDQLVAASCVLIASAAAGFLPWNFPSSKIFMGDVGSGFLGFCFGVLAIATERQQSLPLLAWLLIMGVFVFDATVTLVRRLLQRQQLALAHQDHAYQRVVQYGWTHSRTTLMALGLSVLLSMLAAIGVAQSGRMLVSVAVATALLTAIYLALEKVRPMHPRGTLSQVEDR